MLGLARTAAEDELDEHFRLEDAVGSLGPAVIPELNFAC